jgi:hypothetical protein
MDIRFYYDGHPTDRDGIALTLDEVREVKETARRVIARRLQSRKGVSGTLHIALKPPAGLLRQTAPNGLTDVCMRVVTLHVRFRLGPRNVSVVSFDRVTSAKASSIAG